jgi:hypothetical protein
VVPVLRGLVGNVFVECAALNGTIFGRSLPPVNFRGLARFFLLKKLQRKEDSAESWRFVHSILLKVSLRSWFGGQKEGSKFVSTLE